MRPGTPSPTILRFSGYELDLAREDLRKQGIPLKLQPQPFKILAYLAARPGELISRQELREHIWPGDTFVDFDLAINQAIKQIRAVLNDDPENSRIIATVPRRGYRFIAFIETPNASAVPEPAPAPTAPIANRRRSRRFWSAIAAAMILSLVAAAAAFLLSRPAARHRPPQSLAILPFASPDAADQQLGLALADAVITKIGAAGEVQVRPTAAVRSFVNPERNPVRIARELQTDAILDGRLERDRNEIQLRLQLISSRDGNTLWATQIRQSSRPLFELEEEVASRIAQGLQLHLTAAQQAELMRRYTSNPEAYSAYLAGRAELLRYTRAGALEAAKQFQKALQLAPDYTLARIGLATASADMYLRFASESELQYWGDEAERENRLAAELEPNLAETHQSLAALYRKKDFNWDAVISESRRALELNPSLDQPHFYIAAAYYHLGLLSEAAAEAQRAADIAPQARADFLRTQAIIALFSGKYADATVDLEQVEQLTSKSIADPHLAMAYFYAGDAAKARSLLQDLLHSGSASAEARAMANLAAIAAVGHDATTARRYLADLDNRTYRDHHVHYGMAEAYAGLGDHPAALLSLKRAVQTGFACYPWFERDPLLDPMRSDPDFRAYMRALEAQWRQRQATLASGTVKTDR